jgi:hypothetical protein
MAGWRDVVELAVVGTLYLALTAGATAFAVRVIRVLRAKGRADWRTVWRIAGMRVSAAAVALSGGLVVLQMFAIVLGGLSGVLWLPSGDPALLSLLSGVPVLMLLGSLGALVFFIGDTGPAAFRSFAVLRWSAERTGAAWAALRRSSRGSSGAGIRPEA